MLVTGTVLVCRRLWSANFLKTSATVVIRAGAGHQIARAFDLLSNVSLPVLDAGPTADATGTRGRAGVGGLTLTLEPLEWRVLAVQLVEARAYRHSYLVQRAS